MKFLVRISFNILWRLILFILVFIASYYLLIQLIKTQQQLRDLIIIVSSVSQEEGVTRQKVLDIQQQVAELKRNNRLE